MVNRPTPVVKVAIARIPRSFPILARPTSADNIFNIFAHSKPKEIRLYDFYGIVVTHMAHNLRIMLYFVYHFAKDVFFLDP
jgi:hypothetical protein